MNGDAVNVQVTSDAIELLSPTIEIARRAYSEFDLSCQLGIYPADRSQRPDFERRLQKEFSPQKLLDRIGLPLESLGNDEHQRALFRHLQLFVDGPAGEVPVISIEQQNNRDHWADIVDVLSKVDAITEDDLRRRSYDILEKRMTPSEFTAFRGSDR